MKTTFYFVHAEFYEYGKQAAYLDARIEKAMPESYCRKIPGMTAFKLWTVIEETARDLVDGINSGKYDLDAISWLYRNLAGVRKEGAAA
jgi:hypothetical protein